MAKIIEMPRRDNRPPFIVRVAGQVLLLCDTPTSEVFGLVRSLAPVVVLAKHITPPVMQGLLESGASLVVNQRVVQTLHAWQRF